MDSKRFENEIREKDKVEIISDAKEDITVDIMGHVELWNECISELRSKGFT